MGVALMGKSDLNQLVESDRPELGENGATSAATLLSQKSYLEELALVFGHSHDCQPRCKALEDRVQGPGRRGLAHGLLHDARHEAQDGALRLRGPRDARRYHRKQNQRRDRASSELPRQPSGKKP